MKEFSLRIPTSDGAMPVFAAMPQDVALAPGVLIYMDVFGPREELDDIARRFASAGYLAVVPQLSPPTRLPGLCASQSPDQAMDRAARANQATSMQMSAADTAGLGGFAGDGGLRSSDGPVGGHRLLHGRASCHSRRNGQPAACTRRIVGTWWPPGRSQRYIAAPHDPSLNRPAALLRRQG